MRSLPMVVVAVVAIVEMGHILHHRLAALVVEAAMAMRLERRQVPQERMDRDTLAAMAPGQMLTMLVAVAGPVQTEAMG